jgi:hypothetical protein
MKTIHTFYILPLFLLSAVVSAGDESRWFPTEHLYPTYLADPYALGSHIQLRSYDESTIPETGSLRWDLMAGAPLILYEKKNTDNPRYGWQLIFLGGLRGQFDHENSQDNVAWEGIFGLQAVFRYHNDFAWHFGTKHYSSHVGDEYIERTGRTRIGYTREELRAGLAWRFNEYSTLYSDALDISAYEEDDWDRNITFQTGFDLPVQERRWRFGLEYYDGRSQYGEFFQNKDRYASIGVWMDF